MLVDLAQRWIFGILIVLLAGCAANPMKLFSTKLDATINVSANANDSSPVVVRIYQLKTDMAFQNPNFFNVFDKEATTIGADLIKRDQYELAPGRQQHIREKIDDETQYIAIVAAFRQIHSAKWYGTAAIRAHKKNKFMIDIGKRSVNIRPK